MDNQSFTFFDERIQPRARWFGSDVYMRASDRGAALNANAQLVRRLNDRSRDRENSLDGVDLSRRS